MFEKKKLMINCEVCDARKIREEDYEKYESIMLNTEFLLVNEHARSVIARLPMTTNTEETIDLPDDAEIDLRTINGGFEIGPDTSVAENTVLIVNGMLNVLPGSEQVLEKCRRISVNGSVRYPRSMSGVAGRLHVNGATHVYPDDAIMLDSNFAMDRFFPLRARQDAKYYAANRIVVTDEALDAARLVARNVSFITKQLVVPEALVESLAPLFDENAEFIVVPQGYKLVNGGANLDEALLERYGASLYILGDLNIPAESGELIGRIEKLVVKGCVRLTRTNKPAFDALHAQCDSVDIVRGRVIGNCVSATIDRHMIDSSPDGVSIMNAATVRVREDITPEEITEKLDIHNAALIKCSREQRGAIEMVAKNVAHINSGEDDGQEGPGGIGEILGSVLGGVKTMLDTKMINAETHMM